MKHKIVVIGGYGQVGQVVCRRLGGLFPGKVYAAGRSLGKAEAFASSTGGAVLPLRMDVHASLDASFPDETALIVMCMDQEDTGFVEQCLANGIHYIDLSASYRFLSKVRSLGTKGLASRSVSVLSVGLAPGLTNLLAKQCAEELDEVRGLDLFLMLGLGDRHGKAAIEWMVDHLNVSFPVREGGLDIEAVSFSDGLTTSFPGKTGRRRTYRFPFADQRVVPDTLGIDTASTRICFDSVWATETIARLRKLGALRVLRHRAARGMVVGLFRKLRLGSDACVAKASAEGTIGGREIRFECSIQGRREFEITGEIAAFVAQSLYTREYRPGVYHIEELFRPMAVIEALGDLVAFEQKTSLAHRP
ncbi:saccharopine dehydrogenase family protein [Paenibacillus arenilitoris]|uniref:Saccharopine dehydrogenase NADP-binding domain-containing protein n=1 Tax=Paenibacillus arenilitoris TaxID=2772299 RepID=A0A927CP27_9BACL|nr:saccharopine dehydrogenase NADP-binding domain-containing protein [Paenibacillus arenilitoris]MBD2869351.1 saccharopine dehydrogenase NADP-binding domain-containing protein [Paenibacillus arenilitoris]